MISFNDTYKSRTRIEEVSHKMKRFPKRVNRDPKWDRGSQKISKSVTNFDRSQKRQAHAKYSDWFNNTDHQEVLALRRILALSLIA